MCRILVHPAGKKEKQQGRRAWRGRGGQGKSAAPHRGTHDGHTEKKKKKKVLSKTYTATNHCDLK